MLYVPNDEPSLDDSLGRAPYVAALTDILVTAETPIVVGVYGSWGAGKTSLLRQIQHRMESAQNVSTFWFDPWQHQFDEHPAVGLLQAMFSQSPLPSDSPRKASLKRIIKSIAYALAHSAVGQVPVVGDFIVSTADQAHNINERLLAEQQDHAFQRREVQQTLREAFAAFTIEAIALNNESNGEKAQRLAIFIDDLDRCTPEKVVRLLESLKLFLNVSNCVFILGLDRAPVEAAIEKEYSWAGSSQAQYLDKIIQLQFTLPPVSHAAREAFVRDELEKVFHTTSVAESPVQTSVVRLLAAGTAGNPRQVKRVISGFGLMHLLGSALVPDYRPEMLALTMLIQQKSDALFRTLSLQPERFADLFAGPEVNAELRSSYVASDVEFTRVLDLAADLANQSIEPYIHLALPPDSNQNDRYLSDVIRQHREWRVSGGASGAPAQLDRARIEDVDLIKVNLDGASLSEAHLINVDLGSGSAAGAEMSGSRITNVRAADFDLSETNLSWSLISDTELQRAKMLRTNLKGTAFKTVDLSYACLDACTVEGASVTDVQLESALLTRLDTARMGQINNLQMTSARLFGCVLVATDLRTVNLSNAVLYDCDVSQSNLSGVKIQGALLEGVQGFRSNFSKAIMVSLSGTSVILDEAIFDRCDARDSMFSKASFRDASFQNSDLRNSSLRHAVLVGAILVDADLRGADLTGADLSGATMSGARLEGATLEGIIESDSTIWPIASGPLGSRRRATRVYDASPRGDWGAKRRTD